MLKQQGDGNMFVFGSADLSATLMNENLFDEYRLAIAPALHGRGRRLFNHGSKQQQLKLLEARPLSTGGVILRYQQELL
jgi:dihydrofolate reductase